MTHLQPTRCPYCRRDNPLVSEPGGGPALPNDGDVSICWKCGEVAIFDNAAPHGLRKPDPREAAEIAADNDIQAALFAREVALKVIP